MEKELISTFTKRVAQGTKSELVVIQYDIILQGIEDAKLADKLQELDKYNKSLQLATNFVNELISTLNFDYEISKELFNLYININEYIVEAKRKKDVTLLEIPTIIIEKLRFAFNEISSLDDSEVVMQNTQQVYAGLTYGKENLNETLLNIDNNRGFKA